MATSLCSVSLSDRCQAKRNNFKRVVLFYLNARTGFWCWLSYVCQIHSNASTYVRQIHSDGIERRSCSMSPRFSIRVWVFGFGVFWLRVHVLDFVLEVLLQRTVLLRVDLWWGVMVFGFGVYGVGCQL